ncbi:hypothetical protein CsSME_00047877 [Camellia sinensis var. sinensis]
MFTDDELSVCFLLPTVFLPPSIIMYFFLYSLHQQVQDHHQATIIHYYASPSDVNRSPPAAPPRPLPCTSISVAVATSPGVNHNCCFIFA